VLRRPQREFWYEIGADWESMIEAYRHDGFGTKILPAPANTSPPPDFAADMPVGEYT
jgi:hypothetical protein